MIQSSMIVNRDRVLIANGFQALRVGRSVKGLAFVGLSGSGGGAAGRNSESSHARTHARANTHCPIAQRLPDSSILTAKSTGLTDTLADSSVKMPIRWGAVSVHLSGTHEKEHRGTAGASGEFLSVRSKTHPHPPRVALRPLYHPTLTPRNFSGSKGVASSINIDLKPNLESPHA